MVDVDAFIWNGLCHKPLLAVKVNGSKAKENTPSEFFRHLGEAEGPIASHLIAHLKVKNKEKLCYAL